MFNNFNTYDYGYINDRMFGNCICSKSLDCREISSLLNKTKETNVY